MDICILDCVTYIECTWCTTTESSWRKILPLSSVSSLEDVRAALIVRLPLNQVGSVNKIKRVLNKLEQENEHFPTIEEIAAKVDIPEEKVADAIKSNGRHVSVDAPFAEGEENSL